MPRVRDNAKRFQGLKSGPFGSELFGRYENKICCSNDGTRVHVVDALHVSPLKGSPHSGSIVMRICKLATANYVFTMEVAFSVENYRLQSVKTAQTYRRRCT